MNNHTYIITSIQYYIMEETKQKQSKHDIEKLYKHDIEKLYKQKVINEKKFYCKEHNYAFNCITSLNKHLNSKMHHHERYIRYHCELCNIHTHIKSHFTNHLNTKKHQRNTKKFQVKEELPIVYNHINRSKNMTEKTIEQALVKYNYEKVENKHLAEFLEFSKKEIAMMETFWEPCFNKSWIYLPREMIERWFCKDDKSISAVKNFYNRILFKKYEKDYDYKELEALNSMITKYKFCWSNMTSKKKLEKRGGSNAKYYAVTGECFKMICMERNRDIRRYYIKIEKLAVFMKDYVQGISSYQIIQSQKEKEQLLLESAEQIEKRDKLLEETQEKLIKKEVQLKIEQERHVALREAVEDVITLEKNQIFYIATSDYYQRRNRYKYGGVDCEERLKTRLSSYNGDRAEGDRFYFIFIEKCHDYKSIEAYLRGHLPDYCKDSKDRYLKEMVKCPWKIFKEIVYLALHPSGKLTDLINEKRDEIIEGIAIDDLVKKLPIALPDKPVNQRNVALDAEQLSTDRVLEIMTNSLNRLAKELGHIGFNLTQQRDEKLDLELKWTDVIDAVQAETKISRGKLGINRIWKPIMKQIIRGSNCIKKVKGVPV